MAQHWRHSRKLLVKTFWSVPVIVTLNDCVLYPKQIDDRCMQPALNPHNGRSNDWAVVFKFGVLRYKFERGAIYVMRSPEHPRRRMVRRLIGLEGDWVAIPGEAALQRIEKVPVSLIEGKVVSICWPPFRIGRVLSSPAHDRLLIKNDHAFQKS